MSRELWPNVAPAECRRLAADMVARGARGVKIWVFGNEPALQRDRVLAVRDALGSERALFVDANQGFSPRDALAFAEAIAGARPDWLEDPVHKDDLAGLGWSSQRSPVALAAGENAYGLPDLKRLLDAAKLDAILIDLQRIGGISGWIEAEALCVARDVRVSSHLFPEIGARLLAGSRSQDAIVEVSAFFDPVFGPPKLVDGEIVAEPRAGATSHPVGVVWQ